VVTKDEKYIDYSKVLCENCPRSSLVAETALQRILLRQSYVKRSRTIG
jgi:hypothetical protein